MKTQGDRTIHTPTADVSRRQRAHTMFLAGSSVDQVIAATGLKRITANMYFWEAKHIFKQSNDKLMG